MLGDLNPLGDSPLGDSGARVPKMLSTAELEGKFIRGESHPGTAQMTSPQPSRATKS